MAFPWHFSIRTKVLFVLLSVVVPSIALYLFLASRISVQDKTLLLYELNQTEVRTLGVGADARVSRVLERLRLVLTTPDSASRWLGDLEGDPELLRITKVNLDKKAAAQTVGIKREPWLSYGIGSIETRQMYEQIDRLKPIDWKTIDTGQAWIVGVPLTRKSGDLPPVYRVAIRLRGQAAVADVRAEPLLQGFLRPGTAELALIGSDGQLLAGTLAVEGNPLYQAALQSKVRSEVRTFDTDGESYLGSFYRLSYGELVMLARSRTSEAYQAAWILIRKTVLYALVIISAAFLVALFFSHQLTQPIMRLVDATKRLAAGDFTAKVAVAAQVGRGQSDEISVLARSFNTMTGDIRKSREQIEEYSRDLEKKVADRTAAIREAQEALLRTTRLASVGEVAGRAAHEVLNPLTAIMTRTEKVKEQVLPASLKDVTLLKEIITAWKSDYTKGGIAALGEALAKPSQALPGKTLVEEDLGNLGAIGADTEKFIGALKKDLDFILSEANRIAKIVNGMRSLTRVSGSKKAIVLVDVVKDALGSIGDVLMKAGVASQIHAGPDAKDARGLVLFDRDELIQLLLNLFRNSLQAMLESAKKGEGLKDPRIDVKLTQKGTVFELRISDNGPGIAQEHQIKIFDASFTTKGADEGTGLGLSIARRFARAYDGDLILEKSVAFKETTFLMTLPIVNPKDET